MTASPQELTLMLYDGSLRFLNQALSAIEEGDFIKSNTLIIKVEDIIREFQMTLDFKYEVSNNLNSLYDYMYRRLVEGNMRKDTDALNEVLKMLREMRDTWKQAMTLAKQQNAEA
jgi:flagellar protein FliS